MNRCIPACVITNGILKVTRFFVLTGFAVTCKFLKNIPFYWKFSLLNLSLKAIFFSKHIGVELFRSSLMGQNICIYSLCAKEVLLFFHDSSKLTKVSCIKLFNITKDAHLG